MQLFFSNNLLLIFLARNKNIYLLIVILKSFYNFQKYHAFNSLQKPNEKFY